jgi:hypothetical protein
MTTAASSTPDTAPPPTEAETPVEYSAPLPEGYDAIRSDPAIQFEPLPLKAPEPREPSWFEQMLQAIFDAIGALFSPLGGAIAGGWSVIQWVLVAALVAFILYLVVRLVGPMLGRKADASDAPEEEDHWRPDQEESLALLEDADRLAGEGQYDEAAHLLLKRSVGQIAKVKPDWVAPSSTARELAALPALSESARGTFGIISSVVESSLFALQRLSKEDWERARQAYADFALARIDGVQAGEA